MNVSRKSITLYKFIPAQHAVTILSTRLLKVTTYDELNDPFEMRPALILPPGVPQHVADSALDKALADIKKTMGMVCMSATVTDPVLWSHYADKHQGIALEFNHRINDKLVKVHYDDSRIEVDIAKLTYDASKHLDLGTKIMRRKYTSWIYEQEYRVFVALDTCAKSDGVFFTRIPLAPMPDEFLKRVILGAKCRTDPSVIEGVLERSRFTDVEVTRARLNPTEFKIDAG